MSSYTARPARCGDAARRDRGYSLTEMLVVIVILGILAGIAIPFFMGQRQKAMRAAVQADLRNASTALDDAAAAHEGDYTAAGIPLDTVLGPDTVVTGSRLGLSGSGRGAAASAVSAATLSFRSSPNVLVWIETMSTTTYCMNATHTSLKTLWNFDRTRGTAIEGGCSADSAVPEPAAPDVNTNGPSSTGGTKGGGSGSCDPKDDKCLAQAEAEALGCKVDDEACLKEARQKEAAIEAEKYGCKVGDDACIAEGRKKAAAQEAEKYGCEVGDSACITEAKVKAELEAAAEKYGCKPSDVDCLNAAKEKEAALAQEQAAEATVKD
jgi:prepilin-type N-terminal cleavage/methylation domain-containing protein